MARGRLREALAVASRTAIPGTRPPGALSTVSGIVAILFWSTTIAVARSLSETVGPVTGGAAAYTLGGIAGLLVVAARGRVRQIAALPRAYLFGCGAVFVADVVCLFLAVGLAENRQQAIEVGILNYLWPALTLVFAIPIRGARARPWFWAGAALAIAGAALAPIRPGEYSAALLLENLAARPAPYVLGLAAGVLWALYSNLARRFAGDVAGSGVPLFVLAAGLLLAVARAFLPEETRFTPRAGFELLFVALVPTVAAFVLWGRRSGGGTSRWSRRSPA